jgi:hypothetical protein
MSYVNFNASMKLAFLDIYQGSFIHLRTIFKPRYTLEHRVIFFVEVGNLQNFEPRI